ncbi:MAG: hypothetical protein ACYDCK_06255 [Thermoplasmatota archaeon]
MLTVAATAFAGCIGGPSPDATADLPGAPAFLVSRVYAADLTPDSLAKFSDAKDPETAFRQLLTTSLVARVGAAGDYTLDYTDSSGAPATIPLPGLAPGKPGVVTGADPFSGAVLKQGSAVKYERAKIEADWLKVGDTPLGVAMQPGASGTYAATLEQHDAFDINGVTSKDGKSALDNLHASIDIALDGTSTYTFGPTADGETPLAVNAEVTSRKLASGVADVEATGHTANGSFTAGLQVTDVGLSLRAAETSFFQGTKLTASRFDGGSTDTAPSVIVWLTGDAAKDAGDMSCAGKAKADACHPSELTPTHETMNATERQPIDATAGVIAPGDATGQKSLDLLERLFALDIVPGDEISVIYRSAPATSDASLDYTFEAAADMRATSIESVTTAAGTRDAVKIVQSYRTHTNVNKLDAPGASGASRPILGSLDLNETVSRTTIWLDKSTYEPVKVTVEVPTNVNDVAKAVLAALRPDAWDSAEIAPLTADQVKVVVTSTASFELARSTGTTRFAPVVALSVASGVGGETSFLPYAFASSAAGPFAGALGPGPQAPRGPPPPPPPGFNETNPNASGGNSSNGSPPTLSVNETNCTAGADGHAEFTVLSTSSGGIAADRLRAEDTTDPSIFIGLASSTDPVAPGATLTGRAFGGPLGCTDTWRILDSPTQTVLVELALHP